MLRKLKRMFKKKMQKNNLRFIRFNRKYDYKNKEKNRWKLKFFSFTFMVFYDTIITIKVYVKTKKCLKML